jgi:hypothetical protein
MANVILCESVLGEIVHPRRLVVYLFGFEFRTAVTVKSAIFSVMPSCSVEVQRRFAKRIASIFRV